MTLLAAQPLTPKADREYVVGGARRWYTDAKQEVLSLAFDDLTLEFGPDVYQRMLNWPQPSAKINVLRTWVLQSGVTVAPAVTDKTADGYTQAVELVGWCERVLADLDTALDDVILDVLLAMAYGSRVAEKVAVYDSTYTGRTQLVVRRLTTKPPTAVQFVVDPFRNVLGIYGGMVVGEDGMSRPRIIPRDKFAIWSFRPRDNDPRGTSLLRPAYNDWNLFVQTLPEYYKYLVQFASPSLDGEVGPNEHEGYIYDSTGQPLRNLDGTPRTFTPEERMVQRLLDFQNGTALGRPSGSKLQVLWSQGEGRAFLNAFELFNNQIAVAITNQLLATEQGKYGSKSQAGTHQDAITIAIQQMKRSICRLLRTDVLYDTVAANYGEQAAALTPLLSLGETEQRNWADELKAAGSVGYRVAPSHLTSLDSRFGLPARDEAEASVGEDQPADSQQDDTLPAEDVANDPADEQDQADQEDEASDG